MFRRADDIGELTRVHIGLYDIDGFLINKSNQKTNVNLSVILFQCTGTCNLPLPHSLSFLQRSDCPYLKP